MSTAATVTSLDGFHATPAAQRADELVRALFDAVNADDPARTDAVLARSFLSYDVHGTRSRTGLKRYHSDLRRSFSELHFEVHENVGVLVEGDLVALRTIITGTHTGDYAGVAPTRSPIQTSASHIFRVRDDQLVEHWEVVDTYRILVAVGAIPRAANVFQQILGVEESPGGLFQERLGTEFGRPGGRPVTREESRAAVRRLYDGVISTGRAEDVDTVAEDYIQNSGWTPDGRSAFASFGDQPRGDARWARPADAHGRRKQSARLQKRVGRHHHRERPASGLYVSRLLPHRRRTHCRALGDSRLDPGLSVLRAPLRRGPGWLSWQQTRELLRPPAAAKRAAADQQNQGRLRPASCGNHVAKGGTR